MSDLAPSSLREHRPNASGTDASHIAREHFAFEGEARELPSERDQNFLIAAPDGQRRLLKIAQHGEEPAVLDLQHRVLERLAQTPIAARVPVVITGDDDGEIVAVAIEGREHLVRCFSWLPGEPLATTRPHAHALLTDLGALLGIVDRALADFTHPAMRRKLRWDLAHASAVVHAHLPAVEEASKRELVERHLARFEADTAPRLPGLRRGVIHNDANDHNVLVRSSTADQIVRGLIDFGDLVHTTTVCEVAIAATYAMLDKRDPLGAAAAIVRGYDRENTLDDGELAALFDLIAMRACTSVTISAHQRRGEPDNEYLGVSEEAAWRLLELLDTIHPDLALATFRAACGREACPRSARVQAWIQARRGTFAPVLDVDLSSTDALWLDLSVGSSMLAELELADGGPDGLEREVERRVARAGASVAAGRWNEARPLYLGALYDVDGDDRSEARTVHLGVDLFRPAGTPVHAPLDGWVHGLRENEGRLDYGPTVILRHEPEPGLVFYTLYGHLARPCLTTLAVGQRVRAGEPLATLGDASVNGGWTPHVHFQVVTNLLGHRGEFPGVAADRDADVWLSISPDPCGLLGLDTDRPAPAPLAAQRARHLSHALSLAYAAPLAIVRGRGTHLYDDRGRAFLDAVNNVPHVGHAHPAVVRAGREQMAVLNTNTRYLHPLLAEYAERLLATFPPSLEVCFFVNSGSEANELALRLARTHTGARDVVVLEGGYHGNTGGLVELSEYKFGGAGGFDPPGHVHVAPLPDPYRGRHRGEDAGERYAEHVREVCDGAPNVAAFLSEALLGCGGQIVPPSGFLERAYQHVRAAGGLCIADEVQIGFGRVGSRFWAFEEHGVVPDVVTLGKPIGNGHPLGAVVTTRAVAESFANGMEYFNTFGGNPVSCAIGLAVLDVIQSEALQENALRVGEHLLGGLRGLQERFEMIGDVRGRGLYIGAELVTSRTERTPAAAEAAYVVERMKDKGVLISIDGPDHNVLKIKPPIVFSIENASRLLAALEEVLGESPLAR
ncbi:MAG: aminotransferase class III-fold pyridoxal phosphate-dependent enzyme [bacterium]|nr:aminotransferase class III-fold pyridoxal phosphate-dependent enzyme [bacterium]